MIPKIIHQSWKTHNLTTYGPVANVSRSSWLKHHPDFKYMFWCDKDIKQYIDKQSNLVKQVYDSLDKNIKKMDLFRYLILFEYGGIYSDIDFVSMTPTLEETLKENKFIGYKADRSTINYYKRFNQPDKRCKDEDGRWVVGNAFFGVPPKSDIIKQTINNILYNTTDYKIYNDDMDPLVQTGPECLHSVIADHIPDSSIHIYSKKEIGNDNGTVGYHCKGHRW